MVHDEVSEQGISSMGIGEELGFQSSPNIIQMVESLFDAQREKVEYLPIWVRLPGLSHPLWSKNVFREIGNDLKNFLEANISIK